MMLEDEYFDPQREASFGSYQNLLRVAKKLTGVEPSEVKPWLEQQDAYTLHRSVRKRIPRNPYTVSNLIDVWESDLVDVESLAKHNDGHRYHLTVIDVFSKFLHIVPLNSKTGKA